MTVEGPRHIIRVADRAMFAESVDIGGLGGRSVLVAVNLAGTADSAPVFFSDESLRTFWLKGPTSSSSRRFLFATLVLSASRSITSSTKAKASIGIVWA